MGAASNRQEEAPLLGFLTEESGAEVRVRVSGGTWIIRRDDIDSMSDWRSPVVVDFGGRAVSIQVKPGATIGFLQQVVIGASDRPMTLPEGFGRILGAERLKELSETWGATNDIHVVEPDVGSSPTVCDCSDPNGFGLIIKTDDCKD